MNIYLRQGNIIFSREFVETLREQGITLTRKDNFNRSGIIINHGNSNPIRIGKKVRESYILNQPDYIQMCSDKLKNYEILKDYYPMTSQYLDDMGDYFPVLAKPLNGHHGYGIKKFDDIRELAGYLSKVKGRYLIQQFIPIKHEFRFNVLDRDVFQVSHKQRLYNDNGTPLTTNKGGMVFSYRSLGEHAKISEKFWNFINEIIEKFHRAVGYNLADYCIDVIKGTDNNYYLSEINSAYGIGQYTAEKLVDRVTHKYNTGELDNYEV